jgi:hypothetical protein
VLAWLKPRAYVSDPGVTATHGAPRKLTPEAFSRLGKDCVCGWGGVLRSLATDGEV